MAVASTVGNIQMQNMATGGLAGQQLLNIQRPGFPQGFPRFNMPPPTVRPMGFDLNQQKQMMGGARPPFDANQQNQAANEDTDKQDDDDDGPIDWSDMSKMTNPGFDKDDRGGPNFNRPDQDAGIMGEGPMDHGPPGMMRPRGPRPFMDFGNRMMGPRGPMDRFGSPMRPGMNRFGGPGMRPPFQRFPNQFMRPGFNGPPPRFDSSSSNFEGPPGVEDASENKTEKKEENADSNAFEEEVEGRGDFDDGHRGGRGGWGRGRGG